MKGRSTIQTCASVCVIQLKLARLQNSLTMVAHRLSTEIAIEEDHLGFLESHLESLKRFHKMLIKSRPVSQRQLSSLTEGVTPLSRVTHNALTRNSVPKTSQDDPAVRLSECLVIRSPKLSKVVARTMSGSDQVLLSGKACLAINSKEVTPEATTHFFRNRLKGYQRRLIDSKRSSDVGKLSNATSNIFADKKPSNLFSSCYSIVNSGYRYERGTISHRDPVDVKASSRGHSAEANANTIAIGQIGHDIQINLEKKPRKRFSNMTARQSKSPEGISFINLGKDTNSSSTVVKDDTWRSAGGVQIRKAALDNFTAFNLRLMQIDGKLEEKTEAKQSHYSAANIYGSSHDLTASMIRKVVLSN